MQIIKEPNVPAFYMEIDYLVKWHCIRKLLKFQFDYFDYYE